MTNTRALNQVISSFSSLEKEIIENYLIEVEKSSVGSAKVYSFHIARLLNYLGKTLQNVTKKDIISYFEYLEKKECKYNYKINVRNSLSSFFKYVVDAFDMEGVDFRYPVPSRHFFKFSRDPMGSKKEKLLTIEQLRTILEESYKKDRHYYIFFLLSIHTGMRIAECATIRIENIHLKERYLVTGIEKICQKSSRHTCKPIEVCFSEEVAALLEDYINYLGQDHGWLFKSDRKDSYLHPQSMSGYLIEFRKKLGFYFSSHWFRHTLITLRKQRFDGLNGREKILDWESEIILNHVPKSIENRVYLEKPVEFKRKLYDKYYIYKGLI